MMGWRGLERVGEGWKIIDGGDRDRDIACE